MRKLITVGYLLFISLLAFGQARELEETKVTPPQFNYEYEYGDNQNKSPLINFIEKNMDLPEFAYDFLKEGVVIAYFDVNADGTTSNFRIKNSVSRTCDRVVIETIKKTSGKWTPGTVNGQQVGMEQKVYVYFGIPDNKTFEEKAQEYLVSGIHKYHKAIIYDETTDDAALKKERKFNRKLRYSLLDMNAASRYQPEEVAILFWQACVYEKMGDYNKRFEKMNEMRELINPGKGIPYDVAIVDVN